MDAPHDPPAHTGDDSLEALMRAGGRPPADVALGIAVGLLSGLEALHQGALGGAPVHGSISPRTVFIDLSGRVGLERNGLAGPADGAFYGAPEIASGAAADARADLFSVGAVLWLMLAGRPPFRGADASVVQQVLARGLEAPGALAPGLGAALDVVAMAALDPSADERFESAGEMAAALERAATTAPPAAIGAWVETVAGDAIRRREAAARAPELDTSQTPALGLPIVPMAPAFPTRRSSFVRPRGVAWGRLILLSAAAVGVFASVRAVDRVFFRVFSGRHAAAADSAER